MSSLALVERPPKTWWLDIVQWAYLLTPFITALTCLSPHTNPSQNHLFHNPYQCCPTLQSLFFYPFSNVLWSLLVSGVQDDACCCVSVHFDRLACHVWNLLNYFLYARTCAIFCCHIFSNTQNCVCFGWYSVISDRGLTTILNHSRCTTVPVKSLLLIITQVEVLGPINWWLANSCPAQESKSGSHILYHSQESAWWWVNRVMWTAWAIIIPQHRSETLDGVDVKCCIIHMWRNPNSLVK